METVIKGKAWVGGDNISTFDIIPQNRWTMDRLDPVAMGEWALEDADPAFKGKSWGLKNTGATIIVAGKNFGGGGKSIEHPIIAVMGAGIKVVLADSFSRFNFRNSVNNALSVFVCEGLKDIIENGDELTVDMVNGYVTVERTGARKDLVPLTPFVLEMMEAGGLIEYTKNQLKK